MARATPMIGYDYYCEEQKTAGAVAVMGYDVIVNRNSANQTDSSKAGP